MLRTAVRFLAIICFASNTFGADTATGICTIVNPESQPVVIGIYRPSINGIEERIIAVPAKTQIHGIPIYLSEDDQFAIAYKADAEGDEIKRATPIKLFGHRRINFITKKRDANTPDVLIEFRGFDETFGDLRDQNGALYIPIGELDAKRVIRDSNQKSTVVDSPLASSEYSTK